MTARRRGEWYFMDVCFWEEPQRNLFFPRYMSGGENLSKEITAGWRSTRHHSDKPSICCSCSSWIPSALTYTWVSLKDCDVLDCFLMGFLLHLIILPTAFRALRNFLGLVLSSIESILWRNVGYHKKNILTSLKKKKKKIWVTVRNL